MYFFINLINLNILFNTINSELDNDIAIIYNDMNNENFNSNLIDLGHNNHIPHVYYSLLNYILFTYKNNFSEIHYKQICQIIDTINKNYNNNISFNYSIQCLLTYFGDIHNDFNLHKLKTLRLLLNNGAELNNKLALPNAHNMTKFHLILKNNHICDNIDLNHIIKNCVDINQANIKPYIFYLCELNDCIICNLTNKYNIINKLKLLLNNDANINVIYENMNCLQYAILKKKFNIAKTLIDHGINYNIDIILQNINVPNDLVEIFIKTLKNNQNSHDLLESVLSFIENNKELFENSKDYFLHLIKLLSVD
jgi:hypothetical protein